MGRAGTIPKKKSENGGKGNTQARRWISRRIARIPNARFTCSPTFRRLAAAVVSLRSFVFQSAGREASARGKEKERGAVRLFKLQVPVEKCGLRHPRDTPAIQGIAYVYGNVGKERKRAHRCSLRLTSGRTTNAIQENVEPRLIAASKSNRTHCRDVLLVFHLTMTQTLTPHLSLFLAFSRHNEFG